MVRFKHGILTALAVSALLCGCMKESDTDLCIYDSFFAVIEEEADEADTRAHFEQSAVKWDNNDQIGVFSDTQSSPLTFTRNSSGSFANSNGISGSTFYAFYPASAYRNSSSSYYVTFSSPAPAFNQKSITMPMVASGSANSLSFKQTCGILHFLIKGSGSYDKVSLKSNDGTYIAGTGEVYISSSTPNFSLTSNLSTEIVANVPSGVNWQSGVDVFFILPPLPLNKGFTITVENTGSNTKLSRSTDKSVTVSRKKMLRYTVNLDELNPDYEFFLGTWSVPRGSDYDTWIISPKEYGKSYNIAGVDAYTTYILQTYYYPFESIITAEYETESHSLILNPKKFTQSFNYNEEDAKVAFYGYYYDPSEARNVPAPGENYSISFAQRSGTDSMLFNPYSIYFSSNQSVSYVLTGFSYVIETSEWLNWYPDAISALPCTATRISANYSSVASCAAAPSVQFLKTDCSITSLSNEVAVMACPDR